MRATAPALITGLIAAALATATAAGRAIALEPGGVFTTDVRITVPGLFGGLPFPAVINPDADYPGKAMPTNESGTRSGPLDTPDTLNFTALPVYAIVDDAGVPWDPAVRAFADDGAGGDDLSAPLFTLQIIGTLDMSLTRETARGSQYMTFDSWFDVWTEVGFTMAGTASIGTPPFGPPNFIWYGMDALDLGGEGAQIQTNDADWASGWPGATLDKVFFPIPEPGSVLLLTLGSASLGLRRGRERPATAVQRPGRAPPRAPVLRARNNRPCRPMSTSTSTPRAPAPAGPSSSCSRCARSR